RERRRRRKRMLGRHAIENEAAVGPLRDLGEQLRDLLLNAPPKLVGLDELLRNEHLSDPLTRLLTNLLRALEVGFPDAPQANEIGAKPIAREVRADRSNVARFEEDDALG